MFLSFLFFVLPLQHNFLIIYISLWQIALSFFTTTWNSIWSKIKLLFCVWIVLSDHKEEYMSFFFGVSLNKHFNVMFLLVIIQCFLELDLIVLLLWCMKTQHLPEWFLALKETLEEMKLKKKKVSTYVLKHFAFWYRIVNMYIDNSKTWEIYANIPSIQVGCCIIWSGELGNMIICFYEVFVIDW